MTQIPNQASSPGKAIKVTKKVFKQVQVQPTPTFASPREGRSSFSSFSSFLVLPLHRYIHIFTSVYSPPGKRIWRINNHLSKKTYMGKYYNSPTLRGKKNVYGYSKF